MLKIVCQMRDIDSAAVEQYLRPPTIIDELPDGFRVKRGEQKFQMEFRIFEAPRPSTRSITLQIWLGFVMALHCGDRDQLQVLGNYLRCPAD